MRIKREVPNCQLHLQARQASSLFPQPAKNIIFSRFQWSSNVLIPSSIDPPKKFLWCILTVGTYVNWILLKFNKIGLFAVINQLHEKKKIVIALTPQFKEKHIDRFNLWFTNCILNYQSKFGQFMELLLTRQAQIFTYH